MALIHSIKLNGQNVSGLVNWNDAEVVAQWNDGAVQANVSFTDVEFVNEAAQIVRNWITDGATGGTGITEAPKFEMQVQDNQGNSFTTFHGCLDLMNGYIEESPVRIKCSITRLQDKQSLIERSRGVTYYSLYDQGLINSSDYTPINYIVEKKFKGVEFVMLSVTTYLMLKELAEIALRLGENIAEITGFSSLVPPQPQAGIILLLLKALLNAIYAALMIIYILDLIIEILSFIVSPVREFKGMNLRLMAEKSAAYLGYDYETSIDELNGSTQVYYLPSNEQEAPFSQQFLNVLSGNQPQGVPVDGLPRASDFGNTFEETLLTISALFNAELKIDESTNKIYHESLINDAFWKKNANFQAPSVLNETVSYNTDELIGRRFYTFEKDDLDQFTITERKGRSIEVVTDQITTNDQRCVRIKGFEEVNFFHALGARKSELSALEQAVKALAQQADNVINFFGGNSNLANSVQARVGMLKISENVTSIPKLLLLKESNGVYSIPSNHKDIIGAAALESKYYIDKSFVRQLVPNEPPRGQKQKIHPEGLRIPLGFQDFLNIIDNSYFVYRGQDAQITSLLYKPAKDSAILNGWFRKKYAYNLKETFYKSDDNNL